jgi:hypothetical protein
MADTATPASPESATLLLNDTDGALLNRLRDGISERADIRAARVEPRARAPEDTKRARLERNQQGLEALFEKAIASPAVNRALVDAGYDMTDLRLAAARGTWARDIAPALASLRPADEREREEQRRVAIREAAQAMAVPSVEQRSGSAKTWIEALELRVRTGSGGRDVDEGRLAEHLIEWAEEAMREVPEPIAATARAILVQHAYGGDLAGDGASQRDPIRAAMKVIMENDESGRYAPSLQAKATSEAQTVTSRVGNSLSASDGAESTAAQRQVADLAGPGQPDSATGSQPGLVPRLRGFLGKNEFAPATSQVSTDEGDGIPEALKRRYAVHVSKDRKTIELFEPGAKTAAITLDARSISTSHNEGAVIADIVTLARDRGWQAIKVSGTNGFKDAVWLEASKAGLVAQHEPSSAVQAAFNKWESEHPANQIRQGQSGRTQEQAPRRDDLAQAFAAKSADERLADPRLRNAQLELMIGIRTAEKELKRPIAEMPEVARALAAAVREQLALGRMFDAPFVRAEAPKRAPRQVSNPKIDADRIPPPRV